MEEKPPQQGFVLTTATVQFLIQLGVLLVAICGFGFSIRSSVQVQAVQVEQLQKTSESLERKIELLRYEVGELKLDLAKKGVLTIKGATP